MFRNVHNPSGSTPQARNAAARRRTVFMALVFALVIGSVGQPVLAQGDGPRGTRIDASMVARQVKPQTICVGDQVNIDVNVYKDFEIVGEGNARGYLIGVKVQAQVADSSIGDINPTSNFTRMDREGRADFVFTAKKPGTTLIYFSGKVSSRVFLGLEIGGDTVADETQVKVEECEYWVMTRSRFSAQGVTLRAIMEGRLTRDADDRLTGKGSVYWFGAAFSSGDCSGSISVAPSEAELTGLVWDEKFTVEVEYLPAALTGIYNCAGGSETIQTPVTPDHVIDTVPVSGGPAWKLQNLYEPTYFSMEGDVSINVARLN